MPGQLAPDAATTLIVGVGLVVTMDAAKRVLGPGTAIAVVGTDIAAIGPEPDLRAAYPEAAILEADGGWVTSGYVNAHQHLTGDRLARCCIPDNLPPGAAVFDWAIPLHAAHTPEDDELSATLSALEGVRNGITTVIEAGTVAHPERVVAGLTAVGVRGSIGTWGWDVESGPFAAPAPEVIARQADVLDRWPAGGLVEGWVTLVGHDLMSDELIVGATTLARSRGARMTFHLSPSSSDPAAYLVRTGRRPITYLDSLDVLGPHLLLAHGVHLDDAEVGLVLEHDVAIASCPWAYLRLGQGVTHHGRHPELLRRGGRLALGCDSENAGDQIDILRAAALFAGLAKDTMEDPTTIGAREAFALATIGGAHAVGLDAITGSIEVGKRADLVVHASGPNWWPAGDDPYLQLVWGTDGRSVRHVLVNGKVVVLDRRSTTVDEAELSARARHNGLSLRARAHPG